MAMGMLPCAVTLLRYVSFLHDQFEKWPFLTIMTQGNEPINMCLPFQEVKEQYYRSLGYGSESQVDMINDAVS